MAHLEERSKKRSSTNSLQAVLLGTVAVAGVLAVALVAPNVIGAMGKLGMLPKRREDEYINAARKRLKERGLLIERDGFLRITNKGRNHLSRLAIKLARPQLQKLWDQKWRILIFDIPEKRRGTRISVRKQLQAAGFKRIQDSVWAYPHACEEFIALLKSEYRVGKDLLYLIVETMEGDRMLREQFGLPVSGAPVEIPPALDAILSTVLPSPR